MGKNDFDQEYDFEFEKEYGFDPKDFDAEDDDFDFDDIDLNSEDDVSEEELPEEGDDEDVYADDEDLAADFPVRKAGQEEPDYEDGSDFESRFAEERQEEYSQSMGNVQMGNESEDAYAADPNEYFEEDAEVSGEHYDSGEPYDGYEEQEEEPVQPKRHTRGIKLPKLPAMKKAKRKAKDPEHTKNSVFAKFLEIYLEPLTKYNAEAEVMDPTDPKYVTRRRREKKRVFKEVYLPAIIAGVAFFLILSFIVGSVSNALLVKKDKDVQMKLDAEQQANAAERAETELNAILAEATRLAVGYNYDDALTLLENYNSGNDKFQQKIDEKKAELANEQARLVEYKDTSGIANLSFHVLMADATRACNKEVAGAELFGQYNKNFVSVEEFSRILNQLYNANYVLVDFNSFIDSNTGVDGNESFFAHSLYLPQGKKPIMLTETMVNYFEYMVDPDKDGTPDAKGHGFANKLVLDANGDIKAAYVDANGQNLVGNYDFVPVLEAFIQEHPDFSYRGARAILAVTGTQGVFGYRTNTSYVATRGQAYYDNEVAEAKKVVAALREKGYTIASYTYSNQAYRSMTTLQIKGELQNWDSQIKPVLGDVNTIVFARGSDIEAYSGTTFDVLYGSGLRFFLNSGSSPRVDANTTFIRQTRLMVTGESMAWYSSQFAPYFDCNVVLDLTSRGGQPAKT